MKPRSWGAQLNSEQRSVLEASTRISLILAGAGTGKTHTLIHKVISTIDRGVGPENILLLTFTNKAAQEMIARMEDYLGVSMTTLWAGTFHNIAARLLRMHGEALGISPQFTIMDTEDSKKTWGEACQKLGLDAEAYFPKKNVLHSLFSWMRNTGTTVSEALLSKYSDWKSCEEDLKKVWRQYEALKKEGVTLDFDDLLEGFLALLRNVSAQDKLLNRFTHVFVDEYQDTNFLQNEIIRTLCLPTTCLTVVGDDAQSIYSFRGAHFQNILEFEKNFQGPDAMQCFKLETNYRSTQAILDYANAIIKNNVHQYPKQLRSGLENCEGLKPEVYQHYSDQEQAEAILGLIQRTLRSGIPNKEIAVLYRAHSHALPLQMRLSREGIPFEITSGLRFSEQAHVKDLLAFLRVLANPRDRIAWTRILLMIPGVGMKTVQKIFDAVSGIPNTSETLTWVRHIDALLSSKAKAVWVPFSTWFKKSNPNENPASLIEDLCDADFFSTYLHATYETAETREDDLEQVRNFSTTYKTLSIFLNDMSLLSNTEEKKGNEKPLGLTLTTVHQAKGLEWYAVFVIGMTEGHFPAFQSLDSPRDIEEERRLFYVAATRAKQRLVMTFPSVDPHSRTGNFYLKPSRFLLEIPEDLYLFYNKEGEELGGL
jgi:DNA helicase-2/ATP-dependent DNA helicase PcrA